MLNDFIILADANANADPAKAAQDFSTARFLGVDYGLVKESPEAQSLAKSKRFHDSLIEAFGGQTAFDPSVDQGEIAASIRARGNNGDLYRWIMSQPEHADLLQPEDIQHMQGASGHWRAMKQAWKTGGDNAEMANLSMKEVRHMMQPDSMPELDAKDAARLAELKALPHFKYGKGFMRGALASTAESLPLMGQGIKEGLALGAAGAAVGSVVPGIGTAAGFTAAAGGGMFHGTQVMEAGLAYQEYLDAIRQKQGREPTREEKALAAHAAFNVGAGNAAMELIPMGIVAHNMPGVRQGVRSLVGLVADKPAAGFGLNVAKAAGGTLAVALSEAGTETLQEANTIRGRNDLGAAEAVSDEEKWGRLKESAIAGFGMGFIMNLPSAGLHIMHSAATATQSALDFAEITDKAAKAPITKVLPEKFAEGMKADGMTDDISIDAEVFVASLKQSGFTPEKIESAVPGLSKKINDALETGGDVTFSAADAIAHFGAQDPALKDVLARHGKLGGNLLSAEEAQSPEFAKLMEEAIKTNADTAKADAEQSSQADKLEAHWTAMGDKLGQSGPGRAIAKVMRHLFTTASEITGESIDKLAGMIPVRAPNKDERKKFGNVSSRMIPKDAQPGQMTGDFKVGNSIYFKPTKNDRTAKKGQIQDDHGDGTYTVSYDGRTFTVKEDELMTPKSVDARRAFEAEFANLDEDAKAVAKEANRQFLHEMKKHPGLYDPRGEGTTTGTRQRIIDQNAARSGLREAEKALGLPEFELDSALNRAKHLDALREWTKANPFEAPAEAAQDDAAEVFGQIEEDGFIELDAMVDDSANPDHADDWGDAEATTDDQGDVHFNLEEAAQEEAQPKPAVTTTPEAQEEELVAPEAAVDEPQADLTQPDDTQTAQETAKTAQVAEDVTKKPAKAGQKKGKKTLETVEKLADVGEKIGGARKDVWQRSVDRYSETLPSDIAKLSLAEHLPPLDYAKLGAEGMDARVLAMCKALRDEVGPKPRVSYKVKRWAEALKSVRDSIKTFIEKPEEALRQLESSASKGLRIKTGILAAVGPETMGKVEIGDVFDQGDRVRDGMVYPPEITFQFDGRYHRAATAKKAAEMITAALQAKETAAQEKKAAEPDKPASAKEKALSVYFIPDRGVYIIAHPVTAKKQVVLREFKPAAPYPTGKATAEERRAYAEAKDATRSEVVAYFRDNKAMLLSELEERLKPFQERPDTPNAPRAGISRRVGDISAETFAQSFGFRGVEFGNWATQAERQDHINAAYDGLMDLADVMKVPPRALTLNGELAIAFGARGKGGKGASMAHYESGRTVINLTKEFGSGALAHEWFHALDNYFAHMGGEDGFVTEDKRDQFSYGGKVRKEVLEAFNGIIEAIKGTGLPKRSKEQDAKKAKDYWSTNIEMAARAFESFVVSDLQAKGIGNDYLARFSSTMDEASIDNPYPLPSEQGKIDAAFQHFADTLKVEEKDGKVRLYQNQTPTPQESQLQALDAIMKVYQKEGGSALFYSQALKAQVRLDYGTPGKDKEQFATGGFGLIHIIARRMHEEGLSRDDAIEDVALAMLAAASGRLAREYGKNEQTGSIKLDLILGNHKAVVVKEENSDIWVLSGFQIIKDKKPGDAQKQAGNLASGYAPVDFGSRHQVGASLLKIITRLQKEIKGTGTLNQGALGAFDILPTGETVIRMFRNADRSTFLHESGHFMFEFYGRLAMRFADKPEVIRNWQALLAFAGIRSDIHLDEINAAIANPKHPEHAAIVEGLEKGARAWEAYFMEGKAPVKELRGVFARFMGWLVKTYKSLTSKRNLNVELTPEIRQAFDRIIVGQRRLDEEQAITAAILTPEAIKKLQDSPKNTPPPAPGTTRVYHGGPDNGSMDVSQLDDLWTTPDLKYAKWYRSSTGQGKVWYVDIPNDRLKEVGVMDSVNQYLKAAKIPAEFARQAKPFVDGADSKMNDARQLSQQEAEDLMRAKLLSGLSRASNDERYKEVAADARAQARKEVEAMPIYQAMKALSHGEKLNGVDLKRIFGPEVLKALPVTVPAIHAKDGTADADQVAQDHGFPDTKALVHALIKAEPFGKAVDRKTEELILIHYGDPLAENRNQSEVDAIAALANHQDRRGTLLVLELDAIMKKLDPNAPPPDISLKIAENTARSMLEGMPVKDAGKWQNFRRAESKAGHAATKAILSGKWAEAAKFKRAQLAQYALGRESLRISEMTEARLSRMKRHGEMKTIHRDYKQQIDNLLAAFKIAKKRANGVSIAQFLELEAAKEKDIGLEKSAPVQIPADLILADLDQVSPWQECTDSDLADLDSAITALARVGRAKQKSESKEAQEAFDADMAKITGKILEHAPAAPSDEAQAKQDGSGRGKVASFIRSTWEATRSVRERMRQIDGDGVAGPFAKLVWNAIADAQAKEYDMQADANERLQKRFDALPKEQRKALRDSVAIHEGAGTYWASKTREELIAAALNTGNKGNLDKMLRGEPGLNAEILDAALANLTAEEWQLVQGIWDDIDLFWPQIEAMYAELKGAPPPRVKPVAMTVRARNHAGEIVELNLRGGYYPVKYDMSRDKSGRQHDLGDGLIARMMDGNPTRNPKTANGYSNARTVAAYPIDLRLNVVAEHIAEVTHDLAFHRPLLAAHKIIKDQRFRLAYSQRFSEEAYQQLPHWLKDVANDRIKPSGMSGVENFFRGVRKHVTFMALGYKLSTALIQTSGIATTMSRVGMTPVIRAFASFLKSPDSIIARYEEIKAMSGEMRHRHLVLDRDIRHTIDNSMTGESGLHKFRRWGFVPIREMDRIVTTIAWEAGYAKAKADGQSHEDAIRYADHVVNDQGSGAPKELAAFFRGSEGYRMLSMFMGPMNAIFNRLMATSDEFRIAWREQRTREVLPALIIRTAFLTIIPAVLGELILGREPDDDEDWKEWAATKSLLYAVGGLPVVRDVANASLSNYPERGSTAVQVASEALNAVDAAWDMMFADDPQPALENAADIGDGAGYVLGLPISTATRMMRNIERAAGDEPLNIKDLLQTRKN